MSLKDTLSNDMKQALRGKQADKLLTLRLLLSEIKNVEIDHGEQDDKGVQKIVTRMVKQWKEAEVDYKKGNRDDLVDEAQRRIKVLQAYLPVQMSDEELTAIVKEVTAASEDKTMGPIIGQVMKRVAGQADGGRVSQLVRELL